MSCCGVLTCNDKCGIGLNAVLFPALSIYGWYNVAKAAQAAANISLVKECVCGVFSNISSTCQAQLQHITGPGVSLSNITSFCYESTSLLNLAASTASSAQVWYAVFGVGCLASAGALIGKTIYDAHKRQKNGLQFLDGVVDVRIRSE